MSATPQDVLREAARILMRDGWTQGEVGTPGGTKCAVGAIKAACGVHLYDWSDTAVAAADLLQNWVDPRGSYRVADWNDAPERTAEDVILALKRAAEES